MLNFDLFEEKINRLSYEKQKKVISNIFGINVIFFDLENFENSFWIKFFDGYSYYRFIIYNLCDNDDCLEIEIKERIVLCDVYIDNILKSNMFDKNSKFYKFLRFLKFNDVNFLSFLL